MQTLGVRELRLAGDVRGGDPARVRRPREFDPNVETIREGLRARRDAMIGALAREMPEGTTWNEPDGGYFLWVDLPGGMTGEALLAQADEVDVTFVKGADFYWDGSGETAIRLAFSYATPAEIDEGIARLRRPRAGGGRGHRVNGPGTAPPTWTSSSASATPSRSRCGPRSGSAPSASAALRRTQAGSRSSRSTTSSAPVRATTRGCTSSSQATHASSSMETSWMGLRAPSSSSPTPLAVRRRPPSRTPPSSSSEGRAVRPSGPRRGIHGSRRCRSTRRRTTRGATAIMARALERIEQAPTFSTTSPVFRGPCRAPGGRARAPHRSAELDPQVAGWASDDSRPRLDPRGGRLPDAARRLSGRVGAERGPRDQSRLLGRLEPGILLPDRNVGRGPSVSAQSPAWRNNSRCRYFSAFSPSSGDDHLRLSPPRG